MKKIMIIFLSVICLVAVGCGKPDESSDSKIVDLVKETETETPTETIKETEQPTEMQTEEPTEMQTDEVNAEDSTDSEELEKDTKQQNSSSDNNTVEKPKQEASEPQQTNETPAEQTTQPAPEATQPQQPSRVEYSPQNVVALATAKTKAAGKVLLTENLDNLLANGQISQEEYNEYYPYDGDGY